MKTIREHLETLPEPYRTQAIANCYTRFADNPASSLLQALANAFNWQESPEGEYYWAKVHREFRNGH